MCNKNCMCNCLLCCQSYQRLEHCNQSDIVEPCIDNVYLMSQECIYSNEHKVYHDNNNPDMDNHVNGNCNTDLCDYNLNGDSQYMNVKQGTSFYPGNLANTNDLHFTASQSLTEQFGSVRPHLNPLYGTGSIVAQ